LKRDHLASGFCIVPNVFAEADIARILTDLNCVLDAKLQEAGIAPPVGNEKGDILLRLKLLQEAEPDWYNDPSMAFENLVSIYRLIVSDAVLDCLRGIDIESPMLSGRPVCNFLVPQESDKVIGAAGTHQDWAFVKGSLDSVTLWFPLFDISDSVYPLQVVPGSHLSGLLPFDRHTIALSSNSFQHNDFVTLSPKRSDAVIFSSFLVHQTGPKLLSTDGRLAISCRFNNMKDADYIERNFYESFYFKQKESEVPYY
jgi:phytanoyl-CoA hydroxylase